MRGLSDKFSRFWQNGKKIPPSVLSLVAVFPSAAVWSIPHRGYCSSFLINYFRQNSLINHFRQKKDPGD